MHLYELVQEYCGRHHQLQGGKRLVSVTFTTVEVDLVAWLGFNGTRRNWEAVGRLHPLRLSTSFMS